MCEWVCIKRITHRQRLLRRRLPSVYTFLGKILLLVHRLRQVWQQAERASCAVPWGILGRSNSMRREEQRHGQQSRRPPHCEQTGVSLGSRCRGLLARFRRAQVGSATPVRRVAMQCSAEPCTCAWMSAPGILWAPTATCGKRPAAGLPGAPIGTPIVCALDNAIRVAP
jgi:hypothetical protein